jgi:hypothetical protein
MLEQDKDAAQQRLGKHRGYQRSFLSYIFQSSFCFLNGANRFGDG